jgi:hypothetical protein
MKNLFLLIIVLVVFENIEAQTVWCPSGAKWIFKTSSLGGESYQECILEKDTFVLGNNCQKIISRSRESDFGMVRPESNFQPFAYTFIRNDSVYFSNLSGQFKMIYYFGLKKGDTLSYLNGWGAITCSKDSIVKLIVDTVGQQNSYGLSLKYYDAHLADTSIHLYPGSKFPRIVERLGAYSGIFKPTMACYIDQEYISLCYYEDDSTVHDTIAYNQCRKLYSSINEAEALINNFSLSPNPSSGKTKISSLDNASFGLKLFDPTGRLFFSKENSNETFFDFSFLSDGFYFVNLSSPKGNISKRLIISH